MAKAHCHPCFEHDTEKQQAEPTEAATTGTYRILVTGSRTWHNEQAVDAALRQAAHTGHNLGYRSFRLVHGAAKGADTIADTVWTRWHQSDPQKYLEAERHPVTREDWDRHGKSAGHRRNAAMVNAGADVVVALPLGNSPGTRGCMNLAEKAGIQVLNFEPSTEHDTAIPTPRVETVAEKADAGVSVFPTHVPGNGKDASERGEGRSGASAASRAERARDGATQAAVDVPQQRGAQQPTPNDRTDPVRGQAVDVPAQRGWDAVNTAHTAVAKLVQQRAAESYAEQTRLRDYEQEIDTSRGVGPVRELG